MTCESSTFHDLGIAAAALQRLPAPVLVLSIEGNIAWANRAAARVWAPPYISNSKRDPSWIQDLHISELGTCRRSDLDATKQQWDEVFQEIDSGASDACNGREKGASGNDADDHEPGRDYIFETAKPGIVVGWLKLNISSIVVESKKYLVLYFHNGDITQDCQPSQGTSDIFRGPPLSRSTSTLNPDQYHKIKQLRSAVFDSAKTVAYMISADASTVVFNTAGKEFVGEEAIAAIGNDGLKFLESFPAWNADFTMELDVSERPGAQLVSTRKNVPERTLGFLNTTTETKYVMNISGECMYEPENHEFVGGLFRIRSPLTLDEYQAQKTEMMVASFETVCNVMPHMVWRADPDGSTDYFNSRWMEFTGLTLEESTGLGFLRAVYEDDRQYLLDQWNAAIQDKAESNTEVRIRRTDGIYKWMLVRAVPLKDGAGVVLAWYGTMTDIHEQVMSRKRNRRKWDQVLSVLSHAEVALFAVNTEGTISLAEGAMGTDAEYSKSKRHALDTNVLDIPDDTEPTEFQQKVKDILSGKERMSMLEYTIDGCTYRTRLTADYTQKEASDLEKLGELEVMGVLGLSIDITDVQARAALEIENEMLQLEEKTAQNASRMKSQFLANMSHEMRTPLAGVIGLVELLIDTPLNPEQLEYVNNIRLSSSILLAIVNDVLDFSKVESGRLDIEEVRFNLSRSLTDLHQLLLPSAQRKGIQLLYDGEIPAGLELLGDPGRIRQILLNLLTNSIKFTQQGSIKLSATLETEGNKAEIAFIVEDTGIGIDKETLDQLFQPFRQGDSSTARLYGGTGLGLAISRNLAQLMNGQLDLDSTPGIGSKAVFTVPLNIPTSAEEDRDFTPPPKGWNIGRRPSRPLIDVLTAQTASKASPPPLRHGHSAPAALLIQNNKKLNGLNITEPSHTQILVVEDNAINQTIAMKTIKKLGFSAAAVWNGQEALDYLESCIIPNGGIERRLPSVVLMDCQMPVLDGYSATRVIRTQSPFKEHEELQKIPIIALTASAIQGDLEKCLNAGMNDYLAKPVARRILENMLRKWGIERPGIDENLKEDTAELLDSR